MGGEQAGKVFTGKEELGMSKEKDVKGSVLSGLFWKFSESVCADIVSFVVSVILARMLLPKDYGEVALVNVFLVFANVFVVNGLGTALIQKKDADDIDFSSVFYANFALSIVLYLVIWVISPVIAEFYNMPHLSIVLRVLAVRVPIAAINSVQNAYVSRKMIFKKFFFATIIGTVVSAVVGIAMAYLGYGVWALVAQILTNAVIDTFMLWVTVKWRPQFVFSWQRLRSLFDYGWKILASSLIKTFFDQISNLVIGKLYSGQDLAFYSRGKKYPELVVTDINSSISSVLFPAIAKHQEDKEKVKSMTRRSIRTSTYILSPLLMGMAAVADPMISWMLTDKWLPCIPYLRVSCLYLMMQPVQTANLQAIRAIGRSDIILKLDIIKRGSGLIFLLAFMRYGTMGVALAPVAMAVVATIVNIKPNSYLIGYTYREQFLDIIPNLIMAFCMGSIVFITGRWLTGLGMASFYVMVLGCFEGVTVYIVCSILFKVDTFYYIWEMAKPIINKFLAKKK